MDTRLGSSVSVVREPFRTDRSDSSDSSGTSDIFDCPHPSDFSDSPDNADFDHYDVDAYLHQKYLRITAEGSCYEMPRNDPPDRYTLIL